MPRNSKPLSSVFNNHHHTVRAYLIGLAAGVVLYAPTVMLAYRCNTYRTRDIDTIRALSERVTVLENKLNQTKP